MLLHLWASLAAEDPLLARMLQSLEPDLALNAPLSAMKMPFSQSRPEFESGTERFDTVWRRAAFLRAKLRSILSGSNAWPQNALRASIQQVIALQKLLDDPYAKHFNYADLDYRAPAISPWQILYADLRVRKTARNGLPPELLGWESQPRDAVTLSRVRSAVLEALPDLDTAARCNLVKPWLTPELAVEYALSRLAVSGDASASSCVQPDWAWLKAGESEAAVFARSRYLDVLQTAPPIARDHVLSQLTDYGADCFAKPKGGFSDWQQRLCSRWIHEPQTAQLKLKNSKLSLDQSRQFSQFVSQAPRTDDNKPIANQQAWLSAMAQGIPGQASTALAAFAKELQDKGQVIEAVNLWQHPGHSRALIELHMAGGDCATVLVQMTPQGLQKLVVPARISQRSTCHTDIVRVSDLDQDGKLEVWWALEDWGATRFDACAGDEGDLQRNLDCSAINQPAQMAEIDGDTLTYFVNDSQSSVQRSAQEDWTMRGNAYPLPSGSYLQAAHESACNRKLVGTVLSQKLGVEEWSKNASGGLEIMDLACAPHPVHPEQTLVALFHELADAKGTDDAYQAGFAVAVINIQRKLVLRLYRSTLAEDGGTRIRGGGKLRLDTARYYLTPKVRAFGVRMDIDWSPRMAEGGSGDQLTLMVEEGNKLRPVLSELNMRSWTMLESGGCFDQSENSKLPCVIEDQTRTLGLASGSTNGWRDLEVMTTISQRDSSAPAKRRVEKTLRYLKNKYE